MDNYSRIDEILDELIKSGSNIPYLKELREESISMIKKDRPLEEVLTAIASDVDICTGLFLEQKNNYDTSLISGISTGIYLKDESGKFKYTVIGGNTTRDGKEKIDTDTVFDIASVTKLYTLLLAFKLDELGLLDLNARVKDVNPEFDKLGDFTFNDLIKLFGELRTDGNIATSNSIEEANERLKSVFLVNDNKDEIKYNDFGSMVIAKTIERIISKELHKEMTFDEIITKYLFEPLSMHHTMFRPKGGNTSGNGYGGDMPHDPKSKALGGVTGHAGLFTNSEDLMQLADGIFDAKIVDQKHLDEISKKTIEGVAKGKMGAYLKHPKGYDASFNPPEFSDNSFTFQGWTGSIASFDLNNKIHNNILVNSIIEGDPEQIKNNKPVGFAAYMDKYQMQLAKRIMLMYIVKKFYSKYCNYEEDIDIIKTI